MRSTQLFLLIKTVTEEKFPLYFLSKMSFSSFLHRFFTCLCDCVFVLCDSHSPLVVSGVTVIRKDNLRLSSQWYTRFSLEKLNKKMLLFYSESCSQMFYLYQHYQYYLGIGFKRTFLTLVPEWLTPLEVKVQESVLIGPVGNSLYMLKLSEQKQVQPLLGNFPALFGNPQCLLS